MKTVFISKEPSDVHGLKKSIRSQQFQFQFKSLLKFKPLPFIMPNAFDVVFISSVRSAEFLIEDARLDLTKCTLACVGSQTAFRLEKIGLIPDFIGSNAGNPLSVSKAFSKWLGSRKVFIPHSNLSLRSIESEISKEQIYSVEIYETLLQEVEIGPKDVYVFTSPSNVDAFFRINHLSHASFLIAWGHSTKSALQTYAKEPDFVLEHGRLDELEAILNTLIKS